MMRRCPELRRELHDCDRTRDLQDWVEACLNFMKHKIRVFALANNHYGGYAPDTLRLFEKLMEKK